MQLLYLSFILWPCIGKLILWIFKPMMWSACYFLTVGCQFVRSSYLQSCKHWLRWVFNDDDMFGIHVYWCSLLLLLDLQTWNNRRNLVCVAYYVVEFEHVHIQLKVTLVKTKPVEIISEKLVENLSWIIFYAIHYFLWGTSNLPQQ